MVRDNALAHGFRVSVGVKQLGLWLGLGLWFRVRVWGWVRVKLMVKGNGLG